MVLPLAVGRIVQNVKVRKKNQGNKTAKPTKQQTNKINNKIPTTKTTKKDFNRTNNNNEKRKKIRRNEPNRKKEIVKSNEMIW